MKKLFLSLLILVSSIGLFAETGYLGSEWGTAKEDLEYLFINPKQGNDKDWENVRVREKKILGEMTKLYYFYPRNILTGICYRIPEDKTDLLISKYKTQESVIKCRSMDLEEFKKTFLNSIASTSKDSQKIELFIHTTIYMLALGVQYREINLEEGPGTIYIYNYNDDTNVCVIKSLVKGYTFVIYLPHEQDY